MSFTLNERTIHFALTSTPHRRRHLTDLHLAFQLSTHGSQNDFQGSSKILITSIQEKVSSRMVKAGDDLEGLLEEERAGAVEVEKMIGKDQSNVGKV